MIGDSEVKTPQELAAMLAVLTPEWNQLKLVLVDPDAYRMTTEQIVPYSRVSEHYEASRLLTPDQKIVPYTEVKVTNGPITIDCPFHPIEMIIDADGHSYMQNCPVDRWAEMLNFIKERVKTEFLSRNYVIRELEALLNQKDDSPGNIDAENIIHFRANID